MTTTKNTRTTKPKTTPAKRSAAPKSAPKTVQVTKKIELAANSLVSEILEAVVQERTKAQKINLLQTYGGDFLKALFIWNYDESVISMIPAGEVPYQPLSEEAAPDPKKGIPGRTTIRNEWTRFYHFVKGGNDAMNKIKRESMFINLLESLHPKEAEIICLVKDKNLQSKYNISKEVISEAYPDITWGGRS